jgi:hypothetical protein
MAGPGEYAYVRFRDALVAVIVGERFPDWQVPGRGGGLRGGRGEAASHALGNGRPFALDALKVKRLHDRQRREARASGS